MQKGISTIHILVILLSLSWRGALWSHFQRRNPYQIYLGYQSLLNVMEWYIGFIMYGLTHSVYLNPSIKLSDLLIKTRYENLHHSANS